MLPPEFREALAFDVYFYTLLEMLFPALMKLLDR